MQAASCRTPTRCLPVHTRSSGTGESNFAGCCEEHATCVRRVAEYAYAPSALISHDAPPSPCHRDSVFIGVATLFAGSSPYFTGSMRNFVSNVTVPSGEVPGCITPAGSTGVLYHAKPVLIWGAYLAATASGDFTSWSQWEPQMEALLTYWNSSSRFEPSTGLWHWHDQLESGCDNLVLSQCPSQFSTCWSEAEDAYTLASPDLQVFIYREYKALALFKARWAAEAERTGALDAAQRAAQAVDAEVRFKAVGATIRRALNDFLWFQMAPGIGWWAAYNRTQRSQIRSRTFQMALPLWEDLQQNQTQVDDALAAVTAPDMLSEWGINSVSSVDSQYNNVNMINPYSNCKIRGRDWLGAGLVQPHQVRHPPPHLPAIPSFLLPHRAGSDLDQRQCHSLCHHGAAWLYKQGEAHLRPPGAPPCAGPAHNRHLARGLQLGRWEQPGSPGVPLLEYAGGQVCGGSESTWQEGGNSRSILAASPHLSRRMRAPSRRAITLALYLRHHTQTHTHSLPPIHSPPAVYSRGSPRSRTHLLSRE